MKRALAGLALTTLLAACLGGCLDPQDRRPGLWLQGQVAAWPGNWSFTDAHREIAIEVRTPYFIPHSVTIWCASLDGQLVVGARAPETKRWPAWVERDPRVRLGIGGDIYEGQLARLDDPAQLDRVRKAYASKYQLEPPSEAAPPVRYWLVEPRSGQS
jgi:hypothetical protein